MVLVLWTIVLLTNIIDSGTVWVKIAYRKEAWPTWNFDKRLCLAGTRSVGLWVATQDYAVKTKKNLDPWMQVDSFRYLSLLNWVLGHFIIYHSPLLHSSVGILLQGLAPSTCTL